MITINTSGMCFRGRGVDRRLSGLESLSRMRGAKKRCLLGQACQQRSCSHISKFQCGITMQLLKTSEKFLLVFERVDYIARHNKLFRV